MPGFGLTTPAELDALENPVEIGRHAAPLTGEGQSTIEQRLASQQLQNNRSLQICLSRHCC